MDVLKFKIWDKINKEWVANFELGASSEDGVLEIVIEHDEGVLVQWTGWVDMDGNDIFEGDYVDFSGLRPIGIIRTDSGFGDRNHHFNFTSEGMKAFAKVIGNRFDNPELTGEENYEIYN